MGMKVDMALGCAFTIYWGTVRMQRRYYKVSAPMHKMFSKLLYILVAHSLFSH